MKISLILLTYNRRDIVLKCLEHNILNAGRQIDELVCVDNGSDDGTPDMLRAFFHPHKMIIHKENLGVAKGYNTGMLLATGTHLVITGCDMLMPDDWLKNMVFIYQEVPKAEIVTIYSSPIETKQERVRGPEELLGPFKIRECMPIERRFMSKEIQREIGFFHEGFGLYGWDDLFWGYRAEMILKQKGLKCFNLVDQIAKHLGTEGINAYDGKDNKSYHEMKQREAHEPGKLELLQNLKAQGWPRFNPYV